MIVKAYAKLNLSLDVINKREDGYHNLESVMVPLEMHDSLDIELLPKGAFDDYVTCDDYSMKVTKYNLVHQAIEACRKEFGFTERFYVNIHKNIFIQAGLGGGSADAGAAINGILKKLKIVPTKEQLIKIGISIGSDVPWSLFNKPAILRGIGDELEFFDHNSDVYVTIVKPQDGLSTPEIFRRLDEETYEPVGKTLDVKEALINDDLEKLNETCFNVLEKPAIKMLPEIEDIKNMLKEDGFTCVMMTGAGSAVFGLTKNKKLWKDSDKKYYKLGYHIYSTKLLLGE